MDGGKTWTGFRGAPGGDDYQNMWINPNDPKIILLVSDQGALVSVNGGETWSSWYNQPTAQFYHVAETNTFPYQVCGGQQESGSACISSRGNDGEITYANGIRWARANMATSRLIRWMPTSFMAAGRTEVQSFTGRTGQVQDVTPIPVATKNTERIAPSPRMFSPVDPHILYYPATCCLRRRTEGIPGKPSAPILRAKIPGFRRVWATSCAKEPKPRSSAA